MGLLQKACETYDAHQALAGVPRAEHQTLVPVSHIIIKADLEITVDQDGAFVAARAVEKSESPTIIPATEQSGGRAGKVIAPHPLCDQLKYIAPYDKEKHAAYIAQLTDWAESDHSHPKLKPILTYVKRGTILDDLSHSCVIRLNEEGIPEKESALIRWRVDGLDTENSEQCWADHTLFDAFIAYYRAKTEDQTQRLCMITGEMSKFTENHPRGIISKPYGAKLISSNDESGFTFRGRFSEAWQAASVGYLASQKAHNALRWLVVDQGVSFGGRTFLCWNPQGNPVPQSTSPILKKVASKAINPKDYRQKLELALAGYKSKLPENKDGVVIAAFDVTTDNTGRLSLTYYNELKGSDFLQRLHDWDETCCWWNGPFGVQSPGLYQIAACAFGTQRDEKLAVDDRVLKQQIQRLVSCRVDRAMFPHDIEQAVVQKASNLQIYESSTRAQLLFVACAVVRKYRYDKYKEDWDMSLEPKKQDRSYQYGRLLAVLEKSERDTYSSEESREPNAIRIQPVFSQRPQYASRILWEQVKKAYLPRLSPASRAFYDRLMGEIVEQLSRFPEAEWNRPLADTYLLGYYLQRNELYTSKKERETEE